ncbi:hypothetical protein [Roseomonas chloroacetimidivorans]|uniref:hypothetical protein n=1 Tax=Roseomonas chloroacetimidivorans TaxID=1766656 RepID=UPI003C72B335
MLERSLEQAYIEMAEAEARVARQKRLLFELIRAGASETNAARRARELLEVMERALTASRERVQVEQKWLGQ